MTTEIVFHEHSTTLRVIVQSTFASTEFEFQCKDQEHRDKMAIEAMVALANNYFNN